MVKANAVGKMWSEAELAYLAGFLDADGAIMALIEKHAAKRFGFRVRVFVKVSQNSSEVLERFKRKFKVGRVVKNRAAYDWIIKDQTHAQMILSVLIPYLQVKKTQARIASNILRRTIRSRENLIENATLADTLSRLNVRSKNRRKNYAGMIKDYVSSND